MSGSSPWLNPGQHLPASAPPRPLSGPIPAGAFDRLEASRSGRAPWTATLTPAELLVARSHGLRPVAAVSATCWMHYGWSWTEGHAEGWHTALGRLKDEARTAGANAVLDVKMRTIPLGGAESMDFTLIGTAVRVEGLPPSDDPVVATVPALEFVKLLEANVVPVGIAVGARFDWLNDYNDTASQQWMGNTETGVLSTFWEGIRRQAHADLRAAALAQGNGVLAHVNFSQMFKFDRKTDDDDNQIQPVRYLGRHIVVATAVDARRGVPIPHDIAMAVDLCSGPTPLTGTRAHHQSYAGNEQEGPI